MIKAFLFDYGGVISRGGNGTELPARLGGALNISSDEAYTLLSAAWSEYSRGKITEDQVWERVEAEYGSPIPVSKRSIWNTWEANMQPESVMIDLVNDLQARGYKVGLLSNIVPSTAADIRKHGGYDVFDFAILSCEAGYAKPEPGIYQLALEKLPGLSPNEIVFIDDQERCLVPARELGIHTIRAENPEQIKSDIEQLING